MKSAVFTLFVHFFLISNFLFAQIPVHFQVSVTCLENPALQDASDVRKEMIGHSSDGCYKEIRTFDYDTSTKKYIDRELQKDFYNLSTKKLDSTYFFFAVPNGFFLNAKVFYKYKNGLLAEEQLISIESNRYNRISSYQYNDTGYEKLVKIRPFPENDYEEDYYIKYTLHHKNVTTIERFYLGIDPKWNHLYRYEYTYDGGVLSQEAYFSDFNNGRYNASSVTKYYYEKGKITCVEGSDCKKEVKYDTNGTMTDVYHFQHGGATLHTTYNYFSTETGTGEMAMPDNLHFFSNAFNEFTRTYSAR